MPGWVGVVSPEMLGLRNVASMKGLRCIGAGPSTSPVASERRPCLASERLPCQRGRPLLASVRLIPPSIKNLFIFLLRNKLEDDSVDAEPFVGRGVEAFTFEDVAEVGIAFGTIDFSPDTAC